MNRLPWEKSPWELAHPRTNVLPPIGTIVTVPDGGAAAVTGRVVRHDGAQCVVARLGDPTYEVWAFVEPGDIEQEQ